jgi:hypothetical protein
MGLWGQDWGQAVRKDAGASAWRRLLWRGLAGVRALGVEAAEVVVAGAREPLIRPMLVTAPEAWPAPL